MRIAQPDWIKPYDCTPHGTMLACQELHLYLLQWLVRAARGKGRVEGWRRLRHHGLRRPTLMHDQPCRAWGRLRSVHVCLNWNIIKCTGDSPLTGILVVIRRWLSDAEIVLALHKCLSSSALTGKATFAGADGIESQEACPSGAVGSQPPCACSAAVIRDRPAGLSSPPYSSVVGLRPEHSVLILPY